MPVSIPCPAAARRFSPSACAASSAITRSTAISGWKCARTAHQIGLKSNCTMLYGHIETEEDRVDHLIKLRELQDETHGFVTFIPLAFHPDNTPLQHISAHHRIHDIREHRGVAADARQHSAHQGLLDDDDSRVAQIAQRFGANDIDGTVVEERIYHDAGATTSQGLRRKELLRLIREAGREPVERDTAYRPVQRTESAFTVLV